MHKVLGMSITKGNIIFLKGMKNQYLLYTISCKVSKSIFKFTVKAFSKNCQCILLAKELKLSKVTKLKHTNWGKRGQGYLLLISEYFERAGENNGS